MALDDNNRILDCGNSLILLCKKIYIKKIDNCTGKIYQKPKIRETAQCFPNELYHQQNPRSGKKNVNVGI